MPSACLLSETTGPPLIPTDPVSSILFSHSHQNRNTRCPAYFGRAGHRRVLDSRLRSISRRLLQASHAAHPARKVDVHFFSILNERVRLGGTARGSTIILDDRHGVLWLPLEKSLPGSSKNMEWLAEMTFQGFFFRTQFSIYGHDGSLGEKHRMRLKTRDILVIWIWGPKWGARGPCISSLPIPKGPHRAKWMASRKWGHSCFKPWRIVNMTRDWPALKMSAGNCRQHSTVDGCDRKGS